jgi:hypothetical protein
MRTKQLLRRYIKQFFCEIFIGSKEGLTKHKIRSVEQDELHDKRNELPVKQNKT